MAFVPYENIIFESDLLYKEIINKIQNIIEPKKTPLFRFFRESSGKTYEGELFENEFKINRIIAYKNSFIPIIYGTIISENNKTKINVKMKLHILVKIFMCIWLSFFAFEFFINIMNFISTMELSAFPFVPMTIILFSYFFITGVFKFESRKSKIYLEELFEAKVFNIA